MQNNGWEDSDLQNPFNLEAETLSSVVEGKFGVCSLFDYKAVAVSSGDFPEISPSSRTKF